MDCSRYLLLSNCHTSLLSGENCAHLLYYMILIGDYKAVEGLLKFDENQLEVNELLIKFTKRLKCKSQCNFSFKFMYILNRRI